MSFVNFFDVFMSIYNEYIIDYSFDSYMKATADLSIGELRLLEVDLPLYLPIASKVRLDITSDDVMHAFAVPSLGIKLDAIPGRLNVIYVDILREGVFFGQCSELCGVNHGFMPIKIIAINVKDFVQFTFLSGIENMDTEVVLSSNSNLSDIFNKLAVNDTYFSNSLAQQKTLATSIAIELARGGNTDIILHIIATNGTFSDLEVMSSESI